MNDDRQPLNLPKGDLTSLRELAHRPDALVVWRHGMCRRVVAVVLSPDGPRWLATLGMRLRLMLDAGREGGTIEVDGSTYLATAFPPASVLSRCCQPAGAISLSWEELWRDSETAAASRRVVERTVPAN